ncbi:MAG: adenylate kinase family protein, partial [Promethearchaeota archaeon]
KKAVVILGSPGTGKTALAKNLAKHFSVEYIDISRIAEEAGLILGVDRKRDTKIADTDRLASRLLRKIADSQKGIIMEGHYADIIPSEDVSVAIVLRTSPEVLSLKLRKRGWKEVKIAENVQAEILSICLVNALKAYGESKVYELDTTNLSPQETFKQVLKILRGEEAGEYRVGKIDWLELIDEKGKLKEFFKR